MKKLLFLCSFVLIAGMMNAQSTKKACSKKCSKTCSKKAAAAKADATKTLGEAETQVASAVSEADIATALEADPAISKKVCEVSGNASYYRESTCAKSGETSLTEVKYCGNSQAFVNVSPKSMEEGEAKALNVSDEAELDAAAADDVPVKKACSKKDKKACTKGAQKEQ